MNDPLTFVLAALALLATPGPTNTLLATSGAAAGLTRSWHLIIAEIIGYMFSITLLALVIGPIVHASHLFGLVLRIGCALFLFYSAWKLWRESAALIDNDKPVSFRRLMIATALNPKAIVFAFVIVPYMSKGQPILGLPFMIALAGLIGIVGTTWIAIGAALRAGASSTVSAGRAGGGWARRTGALVLCVFATLISASAFSA